MLSSAMTPNASTSPQPIQDQRLPLSAAQLGVWAAQQLDPTTPRFNCGVYVEIQGTVDEKLLSQAVRIALTEGEALRARFDERGQAVAPVPQEPLELMDLRKEADARAAAISWMRADLSRCVDLQTGPLVQHVLIRVAEKTHLLYLRHHHIVLDGFGEAVLLRRLSELYTALAAGAEPPASQTVPLSALVADDQAYTASPAHQKDKAFWLELLADRPDSTGLAGKSSGPARSVLRRSVNLGAELTERLHAVATRLSTTPSALLVAAVGAYVCRITGQERALLSLPLSARRGKGTLTTPAMLANQLPVPIEAPRGSTFSALATRVTSRLADVSRHQRYRGEDLQRELGLSGSNASLGTPTVNVVTFGSGLSFGGAPGASHFLSAGPVKDLALNFLVEPDRSDIRLVMDADSALYTGADLASHEGRLLQLLADACRDPERTVGRLRLMSEEERKTVLAAGQGPVRDYDLSKCLHELVVAQSRRTPEAVAAQVEGASLSYAELVDRAGRLAAHLQSLGAGPGRVVGVHAERSLELVVDLLAVIMSGAAYLPLDPELPAQRLAFQIEDADVGIVLSSTALAGRLEGLKSRVIRVNEVLPGLPAAALSGAAAGPGDTAYVIFTSGSTGRPKGVAVPHRGVVNRLLWMQEQYGLMPADKVLQKTPFTFDVSVWEFFWPLLVGSSLFLAEPGAHRDPRAMADIVRRHGITTLHFVPSMLDLFLAEPTAAGLESMRRVFASGEALNPETVGRFYSVYGTGAKGPQLYNLYGPTEASIDVTHWHCRPEDAERGVPIGHAVANTTIHVLDVGGEPVPFGVSGELYLGGVQLATGYVNRPDITAERFVNNPLGDGKLYRTGDLCVLRPDGAAEYLGRLDFQIKIRGFRVELGEIESVLLSHPSVAQAVVTAPKSQDGQRRLVAYVVAASGEVQTGELLTVMRERLPEYMVPAHIIPMQSLPQLASGKVDRNALPSPEQAGAAMGAKAEAPATPNEQLLHEVWCELLGRPSLDVNTSFFALGGDSIMSIRMRSALERRGYTFVMTELFGAPTVRQLAKHLTPYEAGRAARQTVPFSLLHPEDRAALPAGVEDAYPLSNLQSGIVFHAGYEEGTSVYRVVTSVHVGLPFNEQRLRQVLAAVFRRHPALRTSIHMTGFREPLQLVHREVPVPLKVSDELIGLEPTAQEARLREWGSKAKFHEFDLATAPLLAFTAHRRGEGSSATFQLGVVEHHVMLDGWSDMAMFEEILARYQAAMSGEELWLPEVPSSFHRFIAAERRALGSEVHRGFWQKELAGVEPSPLPRPSSLGRRGRAQHRRFDVPVDAGVATRIGAIARGAQLPLKSLLAAVHVGVLHAVSPGSEVLTGVVSHARLEEEGGEQVIGLFLNTLPLRVQVGGASWIELARRVHEHEARTAPHRGYPYGQMVREHGQLSLDSYVNFMDFHQAGDRHGAALGGFGIAETDFPLAVDFMIDPVRGRLEVWLDCDLAVLGAAFCERLTSYYSRALAAVASAPEAGAAGVELRGEAELSLLRAWNDTVIPYEKEATIDALISRQARATPNAPALLSGTERLTYAELEARAQRLAHFLRQRGAARGSRVGVHLRRGTDLLVTLVAVLRTGAAYVPLDPDFPPERLRYIAEDAALDCLVTEGGLEGLRAGTVVRPTADAEAILRSPTTPLDAGSLAEHAAYVMYTSGSTGRPKGTSVLHRNVVNFFEGMDRKIGIGPGETVLALTSISFDISVLELLWPLARGATVAVAPERMIDRLLPSHGEVSFVELCERHRPTLLQATPSFMAAVASQKEALEALRNLRAVLIGGEAFPAGLARQLLAGLPSVRVFNMYGPTETTIWSTVHELDRARDTGADVLPIGQPIANTVLRIVTPAGTEAPLGVAGELWIGGDGVAVGYRNRPEMTAEKFVGGSEGTATRWYRTGDRARWREDGVVEFLGRVDRQIKIAGHRIELDEVESVLSRHPEVASVAVIASQRPGGGAELVAFVAPVAASGADPRQGAAGAHLERWREVWEMAYSGSLTGEEAASVTAGKNDFDGWLSSYTGSPIPVEQMRSWLERTVERCRALGTSRVVDVGVGVGLYLRALAPKARSYYGLDLSETALRRALASLRAEGSPSDHVTLEQGDALALSKLPSASADLVLFNSVVQYFPDAEYLRRALREAVRVAGPSGAVFVGDVRDFGLIEAFHSHVQLYRAPALMPSRDVAAAAARALAEERELCLAPSFFTDFAREVGAGAVRIELKRGHALNELTRFRYDVTLLGSERSDAPKGKRIERPWAELTGPDSQDIAERLAALLAGTPADVTLVLTSVPNRRLSEPLAATRILRAANTRQDSAWELQRDLWEQGERPDADPEDLALAGEKAGRTVSLLPAASGEMGLFDIVLAPKEREVR
jgi:amino acid adenylation domain-containing protein